MIDDTEPLYHRMDDEDGISQTSPITPPLDSAYDLDAALHERWESAEESTVMLAASPSVLAHILTLLEPYRDDGLPVPLDFRLERVQFRWGTVHFVEDPTLPDGQWELRSFVA